jgi:hypothetical protein
MSIEQRLQKLERTNTAPDSYELTVEFTDDPSHGVLRHSKEWAIVRLGKYTACVLPREAWEAL